MKKKLISLVAALVMAFAILPVSAFAITIDKTAESTLDEDNQTTVTLSVGGTQDVENVAVIFVLDYSTSVDVRNAAGSFLTELATKENTNVKAAVVDYSAVAAATEWTTITSTTDTEALLASKTSGGTNYHAGLLKAQELLNSSEIEGYTTYLITISDGITYLWTDDDATSSTYGETMTVPYAMVGSGGTVSAADGTVSVWDMTYGQGTALIATTDAAGVYTSWDHLLRRIITSKIPATENYFAVYGSDYTNCINVYNSDNTSYNDGAGNTETLSTYATNVEVAIYQTATTYATLVNSDSVDYAYAFKMDENHWTSYPFGEQLMDYLIDVSDNSGDIASGEISGSTAETVFSTISDQILYEITEGTVTDVIGEAFNWVGMETVTLSVGDTQLEGTVSDNTVSFDNGNYVLTYYEATETTDEYFTLDVNVPVQQSNGLTLTYDLVLDGNYELPESGTVTLPTNESATIDYTDPKGEEKSEDFPVPSVTIEIEKPAVVVEETPVAATPETGDTSNRTAIALLALTGVALIAVTIVSTRRRED